MTVNDKHSYTKNQNVQLCIIYRRCTRSVAVCPSCLSVLMVIGISFPALLAHIPSLSPGAKAVCFLSSRCHHGLSLIRSRTCHHSWGGKFWWKPPTSLVFIFKMEILILIFFFLKPSSPNLMLLQGKCDQTWNPSWLKDGSFSPRVKQENHLRWREFVMWLLTDTCSSLRSSERKHGEELLLLMQSKECILCFKSSHTFGFGLAWPFSPPFLFFI